MKLYFYKYVLLISLFLTFYCPISVGAAQQTENMDIQTKLAALEKSFDGRLGVSAIDTRNNHQIEYRSKERFPIQSTFKIIAVSAILKNSLADSNLLQQKINYQKYDLVVWSPITEKYLSEGMTISELCKAAISNSDNTATNLIMKNLGGPKAVTAFAHSIGDRMFRLDNWEPVLNSNPNDKQDTSTPSEMRKGLQKLTLGNVLAAPQKNQLVTWMKDNKVGTTRIRAGVPLGWIVADKTGGGEYGIANDIGIVWPPNSAPIVVAIYTVQNKENATPRDDVVASAMQLIVQEFSNAHHV